MNENILIQIVEDVKVELEELKDKTERSEMEFGEMLAYAEVLTMIRDACAGYDLSKIGLDFDIDKKYLL